MKKIKTKTALTAVAVGAIGLGIAACYKEIEKPVHLGQIDFDFCNSGLCPLCSEHKSCEMRK